MEREPAGQITIRDVIYTTPSIMIYQYRWSGAAWNVISSRVWMSVTSTPRCMIYCISMLMIEFVLGPCVPVNTSRAMRKSRYTPAHPGP